MRVYVAIALRVLSRVAERLIQVEKKIDDPGRNILGVVERIEARIAEAQKVYDIHWYEIDDEDRRAALASARTNMEF